MIELFATPLLKELLPKFKEFISREILPHEMKLLKTPFLELEKSFLKEKREHTKKEGLWAPHLPVAQGGLWLSLVEFAMISEALAWTPFGHFIFNCQAPDIGNMELLEKYANKELKNKYLKPLHEGEIRSCF